MLQPPLRLAELLHSALHATCHLRNAADEFFLICSMPSGLKCSTPGVVEKSNQPKIGANVDAALNCRYPDS